MTGQPGPDFAGVLKLLREDARLTQEELAAAAGLSVRTVSDLERGVNRTARKATAALLAGPLGLTGEVRDRFLAAARGRVPAVEVVAARSQALAGGGPGLAPGRLALPPDVAGFTGRDAELDQITTTMTEVAGPASVVAVGAIDGMPGVGKTALAVHAAHLMRGRFPDGQFFVDLHAHTPGHEPMRPEDALASLLAAVGVDPRFLPGDLDERAAMWRERMAGRRALLVLDNAASSSQVAPLLPAARDCLALVTSRRHLGELPGLVAPVLLDTLPAEQAARMFTRLAPRAAADLAGVAQVVGLAGCLPLAVSLLARVFARHPAWTLADLAADTRESLLTLKAEHNSIAAAFELSYQHLDPAQQRLFALLGLHPGTSIDRYAAAALAGIGPAQAVRLLDALHGEGLLTETGYRRYGLHDLLRRYARDHATTHPASERQRALGRLLDYYQHTATIAQDRLARMTRPGSSPTTPAPPPAAPALADAGQTLAWVRTERDSLLACLDHTTRTGQHARVTALTAALAELWRRDGPWAEAITRHTTALRSARHLGDQPAEAAALTNLGDARRLTGDYHGAATDLGQALAIYRNLGDRLGQANALSHLGNLRRLMADYHGAAGELELALAIYRDLGDRLGEGGALVCLGTVRCLTADFQGGAGDLAQALAIYRDLGDLRGQASALNNLGTARYMTGDLQGAVPDLEQALAISRELDDRFGEGGALACLGTVRCLTGDYHGAAAHLEQALAISRDLGNRRSQANALTDLGTVRRKTGDYQGAARDLAQALAIYRDLGNRGGETTALNETATLHRLRGEPAEAQAHHQQALDLARAIGSAWDEAHALAGLGRCAAATGHTTQATALLRQAHAIFQRTGAAEAPAVRAELDTLNERERR